MGAAVPVISAIGTVGGLLQGAKANKNQGKALDLQQAQALMQAALYDQTSPYYKALQGAYAQHAGFVPDGNGGYIMGNTNPYDNPADRLRLQQAEEQIGRNYRTQSQQIAQALGLRGLGRSSIAGSAQTALAADAQRQKAGFTRQLAINAPSEYERRLGLLAGSLNPGLSAGPIAGQAFGNIAGAYGNMANTAGGNVAGALQNFSYYDYLRRYGQQPKPPGGGSGFYPTGGANANWQYNGE